MNQEKINRINELARKSKLLGLTHEEVEEQRKLRQEYIKNIKSNFVKSMDNMVIVDQDGNRKKVTRCQSNINLQ